MMHGGLMNAPKVSFISPEAQAKGNCIKLEKLQFLLNLSISLSKKQNKTNKQTNWLKVKI